MFENLGPRIKIIAKIWLWLGIILSVIMGILFISHELVLTGFLYLLLGGCISIFGSFILAGFAQLVENSDAIRKQLCTAPHEVSDAPNGTPRKCEWSCTCGRVNPPDTYQCECGCWR